MLVKNVMELCIDSEYYNIVKSTTTTAYKSTSTIDVCIYIYTAHCQGIKMKMHIVFNSKNYNDMIKKEEAIYPFLLWNITLNMRLQNYLVLYMLWNRIYLSMISV